MTTPPKVRVCLTMDADAAERLMLLAGGKPRKRGQVASELVMGTFPALPSLTAIDVRRVRDAMDKLLPLYDALDNKAG